MATKLTAQLNAVSTRHRTAAMLQPAPPPCCTPLPLPCPSPCYAPLAMPPTLTVPRPPHQVSTLYTEAMQREAAMRVLLEQQGIPAID